MIASYIQAKENSASAGTRRAAILCLHRIQRKMHDIVCVSLRHINYITFLASIQDELSHRCGTSALLAVILNRKLTPKSAIMRGKEQRLYDLRY